MRDDEVGSRPDHCTGGIEFPGHAQTAVDHAGNVIAAEGNAGGGKLLGKLKRIVAERIEASVGDMADTRVDGEFSLVYLVSTRSST